jgi:hypothetical protein
MNTEATVNAENPPSVTAATLMIEITDLQRQWHRYGFDPIVRLCAEHALEEQKVVDRKDYITKLPFVNQRLAQWVLADPQCPSIGDYRLSYEEFRSLQRATYELVYNKVPVHLMESVGMSAIRAIAFQQFEFQSASRFAIPRQHYIANRLQSNHRLLVGSAFGGDLSRADLMTAGYLLLAWCHENPGKPVTALEVASKHRWFPKAKVIAALAIFGADVGQLRQIFTKDGRKSISIVSSMHRPAFRSRPLFRVAHRKYFAWSNILLTRSIGNVFLQSIRDSGDETLIAEYGRVFESKYVAVALATLCSRRVTEEMLLPFLNPGEKSVDFLLNFGETIVLVEAKVKAADEATQSALDETRIGDQFKNSIIKAIEQGWTTASLIRSGRFANLGIQHDAKLFLLVITVDQHYMSNGVAIAAHTGQIRVEQLKRQFDDEPAVPLEQIVMLSADGLDALAAKVERNETSVVQFMNEMKERELSLDPTRRLMVAELLLDGTRDDALPSYLHESNEAWLREVAERYGEKST